MRVSTSALRSSLNVPCGRAAVEILLTLRTLRDRWFCEHDAPFPNGDCDYRIDAFAAAMPELPEAADGLQPAEDLLDQLSRFRWLIA